MIDREMKKGSAELLILALVETQPRHGYELCKLIVSRSEGVLTFHSASLYPLLSRLEKRGLLRSDWKSSETNRRAKYYSLTARGRDGLDEQTRAWRRSARALSRVLNRAPRKASS